MFIDVYLSKKEGETVKKPYIPKRSLSLYLPITMYERLERLQQLLHEDTITGTIIRMIEMCEKV